jgi:hypothetical protein
VFACETVIGRTIGPEEVLEDGVESRVLVCLVGQGTAWGVALHGGLAGVVGTHTYQEEAVACLAEAAEQCREGMENILQVGISVVWA